MGSRNLPDNTSMSELELNMDKEECINLMQVGLEQDNRIGFLHIVTSEAQELKWSAQDSAEKGEQKHIKKYEWGFFKAKMVALPLDIDQEHPYYALTGLTFSTIYMGVSK